MSKIDNEIYPLISLITADLMMICFILSCFAINDKAELQCTTIAAD
ncbi:hypothetical protein [Prosthecochloris ethylica]|nr:hypothetical protein [Prosthecochloris ethylica]